MPTRWQHRCTVCRRRHDGTGRCSSCRTRADRGRGSSTARGYGADHQRTRAEWEPIVAAGAAGCSRCDRPILPGEPWHLDHDDVDRGQYRGPSHAHCNAAAGGRRRHESRGS